MSESLCGDGSLRERVCVRVCVCLFVCVGEREKKEGGKRVKKL